MKFIQDIKTFFGKRRLNLQAVNIHKKNKLVSFDQMNEIGIVYDAANKQNEENVQRFAASLRDLGKKVFLMGFVDEKVLPHTKKIHIQSEFFWQEKLDWQHPRQLMFLLLLVVDLEELAVAVEAQAGFVLPQELLEEAGPRNLL